MIKLQAAMGLGIALMTIASVLIFAVFPSLILTFTVMDIRRKRKVCTDLKSKDYFQSIFKSLLFSILILLTIGVIILLFLYFFVDLTIS